MTAPIDADPGDGRSWFDDAVGGLFELGDAGGVIAAVVAGFSAEEREFFQGIRQRVRRLRRCPAVPVRRQPRLPRRRVPRRAPSTGQSQRVGLVARLYLIEQYHHMVDSGAVELQRDGEHYWIDPLELTDTNGIVMGEIILAGVAAAGRFSKSSSGGLSTAGARTAYSPMPTVRTLGVERAQSPICQALKPYRGPVRWNGEPGRARRFFRWDHSHKEIEVFDRHGNHLGSMDPVTGAMIKPPVPGRTESV